MSTKRPADGVISSDWLSRPAVEVAPELLGCRLMRQWPDGRHLEAVIVETEAYTEGDPACHAYRRETPRNRVMFGPAGYSYVYLIYGIYHCFNVVTDQDRVPSAVLIRAVELEIVPPWLAQCREDSRPGKRPEKPTRWGAGPGKTCQLLEIDRRLTEQPLVPDSGLWLAPPTPAWRQRVAQPQNRFQTTRIGLTQGTDLPWRWYVDDSPAVSKRAGSR
ncbi:3-methyladenine DNA glycosylase [Leptolyngbya sp. BL0902]|uniref:DNA-3-methyladenine glycosylase n=1 Tax=Leptolyngbya sp. BL0902 TaxID=1115757 RepID=UPI0018E7E134|nr:DNA-3-methyladenine glycosylase [Leptolyngbya sp. BL0902]QQE63536.1 3-methyladenine DNA glycosylase [Leptolyngbya sp. BL0902]